MDGNPFESRIFDLYYEKRDDYLYLENLIPDDEHTYTCVVDNGLGKIQHSTHLIVGDAKPFPPIVDSSLFHSRIDILLGENVTLECQFETLAAASFQFMRHNDTTDEWKALQSSFLMEDEEAAHYYTIYNFSASDEGMYSCWTNNTYGHYESDIVLKLHPLNYTIHDKPQPVTAPIAPRDLTVDIAIGAAGLLALVVIIFTSLKMREYRKNQITVVHAEQSFIIRRVVLEHQNDDGGKCLSPRVKIETETVNLSQLGVADKKRALNEYQLPLDKEWEVTRDRLVLAEKVGEGAFGVVFKATARGIDQKDEKTVTEVAVKMLKDSHTDGDLRDLVSEMEVMKKVGRHTNIISLLGCVTQEGLFLVLVLPVFWI